MRAITLRVVFDSFSQKLVNSARSSMAPPGGSLDQYAPGVSPGKLAMIPVDRVGLGFEGRSGAATIGDHTARGRRLIPADPSGTVLSSAASSTV
jgi:hypothetical protein